MPRARERRRHVVVVVVVAEHGEDAVRRRERREHLGDQRDEAAIALGHVVAAEDDEVRLLRHQHLHRRA